MAKFNGMPDREPNEQGATEKQLDYLRRLAPHLKAEDLSSLGKWQASYLIEQAIEAKDDDQEEDSRPPRNSPRSGNKGCLLLKLILAALVFWFVFKTVSKLSNPEMGSGIEDKNVHASGKPDEKPDSTSDALAKVSEADVTKDSDSHMEDSGKKIPAPPIESLKGNVADPLFLKSLEGVSLPVTLSVVEPVSLLNAAGKEGVFPVNSVIKVTKRTERGTLSLEINGAIFVGNESRLSGKVRLR
jgi:hypothetical protein